jgi:hypothetical protein
LLSPVQLLWFSGGLFVLVALVPLSVWFATGSWVQARRAVRGYGLQLSALFILLCVGAVIGIIAAAWTPDFTP